MYILFLLLAAFFLISIFATMWPLKLYHHFILKKLADLLETVPEKNGMFLSGVYSQINTVYRGKKIKIRFMEGSVDSLKINSGLELRMYILSEGVSEHAILEFYPIRHNKHEWGDFKRFLTGDPQIDSGWYILSNNLTTASVCWNMFNFKSLLLLSGIEQVLLNKNELVMKFKNCHSVAKIKRFIDQLVQIE